MEAATDVIWTGRPWIGPALAIRTVGLIIVGVFATVALSVMGLLFNSLLSIPSYLWVYAFLALIWLVSVAGLMVRRASSRYILRRSSIEIEQGIARRKSLVVSPSGFAELEVDQGIAGRMFNYGTVEVRSQGGQQLTLGPVRNPRDVSAKIREVMTTPTVRVARDDPPVPPAASGK